MSDSTLAQAGGSCGLCGAPTQPWHRIRGYELERCSACGNGFLAAHQVPDDLESLYSEAYFSGGEETGYPSYLADLPLLERNFADRLAWVERSCRPPGRLLDVGAAYGVLVDVAARRGWDAMGVEIAADCAAEAERRTGRTVVAGDFLDLDLGGPFDVVTFFDVIEHMRDPAACVRRACELLSPEGWLILETGDRASPWARLLGASWYFLDPPQHLFYFSSDGLETLAREGGLTGPVRRRRLGRRVSFANAVFKARAVATRWPRALQSLGNLPLSLYVNFGDALTLAIRRS